MNLWYAGVVTAMLLYARGGENGRRFAARLMTQMPVIVAFGVNLGIVPLLFTQLAYYQAFYPATILMAWPWLAIIVLLIPAYYGVYIYASGLQRGGAGLTTLKKTAGWSSAVFFIVIGFLFANGFSLMANVSRWGELWLNSSTAGAALGTALNVGDPSLWPRWLLMFGLALTTTAAWLRFDAAWFAAAESDQYKRWAAAFALKLGALGAAWFAAAGSWYVFGTWSAEVRETMFGSGLIVLTLTTAVAPAIPFLLILATRNRPAARGTAALIALAQFAVLGVNAVSRQVVQNLELYPYLDVAAQPTDVQWSPLIAFLIVFVAGLGVVAWMIAQVAPTREAATGVHTP
jgi:hypothetical protein